MMKTSISSSAYLAVNKSMQLDDLLCPLEVLRHLIVQVALDLSWHFGYAEKPVRLLRQRGLRLCYKHSLDTSFSQVTISLSELC